MDATPAVVPDGIPTQLIEDVRVLILHAREHMAVAVNAEMNLLYSNSGACVRKDILHEKHAEYGWRIVEILAQHLTAEFGKDSPRTTCCG